MALCDAQISKLTMKKKQKRRSHTGSVYLQSEGGWRVSLTINGKRYRRRAKTRAEAEQIRISLVEQYEAGSTLRTVTVAGLRNRWLEDIKRTKSKRTAQTYADNTEVFLRIKQIPIQSLTVLQVQDCINSVNGGRSRQLAHDKFKQMLRAAIKWGLLPKTSLLLDGLDRPQHEAEKAWPFEPDDVARIFEACNEERYSQAIQLCFHTGLRGGELWGLKWDDWNQKRNTLRIDRQASESGSGVEIKPPKRGSRRQLLLSTVAAELLNQRRLAAVAEGLIGCEWVFPQLNGKNTRRSNFGDRVWTPLIAGLSLDQRGFHHARHTYATMALNNGVPITLVAKNLGHKKVSTTLDTYAHVMTHDQEKYRDAMNAVYRSA